ncbi:MAG TPA: acyltransferase [Dysgonamonadaceae bacterium]|jgi:peptidoglycan/LPS O-acetylase OafA/YrhL|nr:acyltransferase [Dysgonamonadaceae bacterium]
MSNNRQHFHTFDALRFFSFLLVFIHHSPVPDSSFLSFFSKSGGIGVVFFFVLSGFLITYILIHEKNRTEKISLKKFYIRRILRIWPLFYAMILFAFITPYLLNILQLPYSAEGYQPNWLMSVLFLENYKMIIEGGFPNVSPLSVMWTLCIEEHFYIVWGILISIIPLKRIPHLITGSILLASISRIIYSHYGLSTIDLISNIDYFAFGAIPAYILVCKTEILGRLDKLNRSLKYLAASASLILIFGIPNLETEWLDFVAPLLFGTFFSLTILWTLPQNNHLKISDKLWISKLGVFTYGLYLFHTIVINLFLNLKISSFDFNWILILITSLITTILISIVSYHIFEKHFLKLKVYFY